MDQNGIIIIDKPADWTSHDVVAKLRGALRNAAQCAAAQSGTAQSGAAQSGTAQSGTARQKPGAAKNLRVGHGGTLDPMATGVLPVFIGRATRAAEFFESAEKEYIAGLMPGIVTDTQDITGNILNQTDTTVTPEDLSAILRRFTGAQKQIPPMYSAVKQEGKKLYELARRGVDVPRDARDIFISSIEMIGSTGIGNTGGSTGIGSTRAVPMIPTGKAGTDLAFPPGRPVYTLRIVCSKGTYIRTLCHDIGAALGCGATMSALRRIRAGAFTIDMAHTLDDVLAIISRHNHIISLRDPREVSSEPGAALTDPINDVMLPIDSIFSHLPSIILNDADARKAKNGALRRAQGARDGNYRFYAPDGEFLLLGEVRNNGMKTIKSFFTQTQDTQDTQGT